jgi:NAD(P)-dependent dehydrogenase (short-subunit alcohol dehydrogenase family)
MGESLNGREPANARRESGRGLGYAVAAGAVAAMVYGATRQKRPRFSFREKSVLIVGGSRGLGLILARQLIKKGARVAICARDGQELDRAGRELRNLGGDVIEVVADVTVKADAEKAVQRSVEYFGRLDCLINLAGIIRVGPLASMTDDDFRAAMDTHFWGPYFTTMASLPHLRERGGRIVNVTSIGAKVAIPHLTPYCASKFAHAGLSSAMRAELAKDGVVVTTVYPGLMRTGSHVNAEFKGENKKEFALFSLLDATPLSSIDADRAAEQILLAAEAGDAELIISTQAKVAARLNSLFPEMVSAVLATTARFLPGGDSKQKFTGLESKSPLSPSLITAAIDREAEQNNELEPGEEVL